MTAHWHWASVIETWTEFFATPLHFQGTLKPHLWNPLMIAEQLATNVSNACSDIRKYVEDVIKPIVSSVGDLTEGFNIRKNWILAPFRWLSWATIKLLESVNRAAIGLVDGGNLMYKRLINDSATAISQNTVDRVPFLWGTMFGNLAKLTLSIPSFLVSWVSQAWDTFWPSAWLRGLNKFVSLPGRQELSKSQLLGVWAGDNHHDSHAAPH